jgi:aldehyde dehydrogenase (NAD+)
VIVNPFVHLNQQFIAGAWRDGATARILTDRNPYNEKPICEFKLASRDDLDQAYRAAAAAQKIWAQVNPYERRAALEKALAFIDQHEADITDLIIEELGGTRLKAMFEIGLVRNIIKEAATYPLRMTGEILPSVVDGKENRLYRVPVGVVGVISPFNFPFFLSMRSVVTALGAGNGVVLKPHDDTPITGGTLVAKLFEGAGLPPGLVNVVVASLEDIGDSFIDHPIPKVISFTGSDAVGRHIGMVAGRCLKKAVLELGGNSALIVLADADLDLALNAAVFSRFTHQGQICMSANRVLVHRSLYPQFVERYVQRISALKVGDPRDPSTDIGPLMNKAQAETLHKQIQRGIDEGAKPALRGAITGTLAAPTVFVDVRPEMSVAQHEMFGPAVSVIPFDTPEEAVRIANHSTFGLSGAIHTKDLELGAELAKQIDSGAIHINDGTINDEPIVAFGGEKASGFGRLNGRWALEEFTTLKWISVQHTRRHFPFEPS